MTEDILRIVVGVDFTEAGDHAIDEAIRYARKLSDSELHPVFVVTEERKRKLATIELALSEARDQLRQRLVARCEALGQGWDQDVVFHVRIGEPAAAIHQVAVDVSADLVVVGTHGRRGLPKMLIGSVAEELVRSARVPVLVARPKQLEDLPRTPAPDPASPGADLRAPRVMASEHLVFGRRDSHVSGLV
jgi:nucleotide-binding universal stress UspA family protein